MMLATMLILGVGGGITLTAANAMGSDVSEARRDIVLNFLNVFVGLGGLVTPFVAGNLLSGDAIRVAYGAAILTSVTFQIQLVTKVPLPPPAPRRRVPAASSARRCSAPSDTARVLRRDGRRLPAAARQTICRTGVGAASSSPRAPTYCVHS